MDHIHDYLQQRGIVCELEKNETPFAVFWPTREADANSLQELGKQLHKWMMANRAVTRILGLERLLDGHVPEVAVLLLMIPIFPNDPKSWVEKVGLVVIDCAAEREELTESLCELIEGSGIAHITSWEQYSYMNR